MDPLSKNYKIIQLDTPLTIYYNSKKNIAILPENCIDQLAIVKQEILKKFNQAILWIDLDLSDDNFKQNITTVIDAGFKHPYMTIINPALLRPENEPKLAFVFSGENSKTTSLSVLNKALHALQQYKSAQSCFLYAKLSPQAVEYLKSTSTMGQNREFTGELIVKQVSNLNGRFVYTIDVDKQSVGSGSEEDVNVTATRYNFHSHPEEAYIRHSVEKAWPSLTDFLGYHTLGTDTIFHCVATLEGLYIMSFSAYWGKRLKQLPKAFIQKHFDIDSSEDYTPAQFVQKINRITKNNHPIFILYFFPWKKATTTFKIYFSPLKDISCIPTQQGLEYFSKIHD